MPAPLSRRAASAAPVADLGAVADGVRVIEFPRRLRYIKLTPSREAPAQRGETSKETMEPHERLAHRLAEDIVLRL